VTLFKTFRVLVGTGDFEANNNHIVTGKMLMRTELVTSARLLPKCCGDINLSMTVISPCVVKMGQ